MNAAAPDDAGSHIGAGGQTADGGGRQSNAMDASKPDRPAEDASGGTADAEASAGSGAAGNADEAGAVGEADGGGGAVIDGGGGQSADAGDPSLGWQKAITFDGSQLAADLTAFPVLVRVTDSELGMQAAQNGTDIYFVDQLQATTLAHEVESYDGSTGSLLAWVRLPTLSAATDSVIYLRYGDGGRDRSDPGALWNDHHYVWHMAQDPGPGASGDIRDSTGRAHGTANSTMTAADLVDAVVGKGIEFDGTDDEITFENDFTGTANSTLSAWVNQQADNDGMSDTVVSFGTAMTGQTRLLYSEQASTDHVVGGFYDDDVDSNYAIEGLGWKYIAWVWDGSSSRFYANGVLVSGPTAHTGADTTGSAGKIANATWAARFLRGQLDEVRVSEATRSPAWIKAEYDNQRPDSTFLKSLGAQEIVTAP